MHITEHAGSRVSLDWEIGWPRDRVDDTLNFSCIPLNLQNKAGDKCMEINSGFVSSLCPLTVKMYGLLLF